MNDFPPDTLAAGEDAAPSLLWRAAMSLLEDAAILVFDATTRTLLTATPAARRDHLDADSPRGTKAAPKRIGDGLVRSLGPRQTGTGACLAHPLVQCL